ESWPGQPGQPVQAVATDHLEEQREIEQAWRRHLLSEPSEKAFRVAYDEVHAAMRRRPGREMIYAARLSRVDRSFLQALNSARSVLDFGVGNGRFALAAATGR